MSFHQSQEEGEDIFFQTFNTDAPTGDLDMMLIDQGDLDNTIDFSDFNEVMEKQQQQQQPPPEEVPQEKAVAPHVDRMEEEEEENPPASLPLDVEEEKEQRELPYHLNISSAALLSPMLPPVNTSDLSPLLKLSQLMARVMPVYMEYLGSIYAKQACMVTDLDSIVDSIRKFGFARVKVPIMSETLSELQNSVTTKLEEYRSQNLLSYMNLNPSGQLLDIAMKQKNEKNPCIYNTIMSGNYTWNHILYSHIPVVRQIIQKANPRYADETYSWFANLQPLFYTPIEADRKKAWIATKKTDQINKTVRPLAQGGDIGSTCYFSPYVYEWYHLQLAKETNKQAHLSEWEHLQFFMPIQTEATSPSNFLHVIPGFQFIFDDLMTMIRNNEIDNTETKDSLTDTLNMSPSADTTAANEPFYGNTYYRLSTHIYNLFKSFRMDINFVLPNTEDNSNYNQIFILDPRMGLSFSMITDKALMLPFSIWPVNMAANATRPPAQLSTITQIRTMEYDNKTVVSSKEENLVQNILYSTLRRAHFLDTVLISRKKNSADMSKTITTELTKKYGAQGGPIKEYCINGFPGSYAREASDAVLQQNIKQFVDAQLPHQKKQQQLQHANTKDYESMDQFGTMLNSTLHQLTTLTVDSHAPPKSLDLEYVATPPMCSKCGSVAFTMVEFLSMSPDEVNTINVSSPNLPKSELACLQCLWNAIK